MSGFGVFSVAGGTPRIGWRDGDEVVDLSGLGDVYAQPSLNALMALGRDAWDESLAAARAHDGPRTQLADATMHLPFEVADYVDFYSSLEHATNMGRLFRPDAEPLLAELALAPGRLPRPRRHRRRQRHRRPSGRAAQLEAPGSDAPEYAPTRRLDIELELGFVVGVPTDAASRSRRSASPTTSSASCS